MPGPVMVTGSRGFAGRPLVAGLRAAGCRVVGLDLQPAEHPDDRCVDLSRADLIGAIVANEHPDRVCHLAGMAIEPADAEGRARLLNANIGMTLGLLDALVAAGCHCRFLLAGSCSVYGIPLRSDGRVVESDPVAPILYYGFTKAAQEELVRVYHRRGSIDLLVARLFNVTGPGEGPGTVLGAVARQIHSGAAALRLGNVDTVRDFLDVRDAASAFRAILERGQAGLAYNVGCGNGETVRDRVLALSQAAGMACLIQRDEARVKPVDVKCIVADTKRLRELGWQAEFDAACTSRDLMAWLATRGTGVGPAAG